MRKKGNKVRNRIRNQVKIQEILETHTRNYLSNQIEKEMKGKEWNTNLREQEIGEKNHNIFLMRKLQLGPARKIFQYKAGVKIT